MFGKKEDDDLPEVKLNKNEPKSYYDKTLKCWMIEGQEEEIKKKLEEKNKPPPTKKQKENMNTTTTTTSAPNQVKKKPNIINRYAPVINSEHTVEEISKPEETVNCENIVNREIIVNNEEIYKPEENVNIEEPNIKNHLDLVNERVESEIKNEVLNSELRNQPKEILEIVKMDDSIYQPLADIVHSSDKVKNVNIEEIENNLKIKYETEINEKIFELEKTYQNQIEELHETIQFIEENSEEEKNMLKTQLNKFIQENLDLEMKNNNLKDDLEFKVNEVEKYQMLVQNYQNVINELNSKTVITSEQLTGDNENISEFIYINKLEKLEYDKIFINNELIEARREISNLNLEKSLLEYKIKEIENINITNIEKLSKLSEALIESEKNLSELTSKNISLSKKKEQLQIELNSIDEIRKNNEDLKKMIYDNSIEIQELSNKNNKLNNEMNNLSYEIENLKIDRNSLMKNLDEKDNNYTKVINELRQGLKKLIEEKVENDVFQVDMLNQINNLNLLKFNNDKTISKFIDNIDNLKRFIVDNLKKDEIFTKFNQELEDINLSNFDHVLCYFIKCIQNELSNYNNEKLLLDYNNCQRREYIGYLNTEVEFLKKLLQFKNDEVTNLKIVNENLCENIENIQKSKLELERHIQTTKENCENRIKEINDQHSFSNNKYESILKQLKDEINNQKILFDQENDKTKEELEEKSKLIVNMNERLNNFDNIKNEEINRNKFFYEDEVRNLKSYYDQEIINLDNKYRDEEKNLKDIHDNQILSIKNYYEDELRNLKSTSEQEIEKSNDKSEIDNYIKELTQNNYQKDNYIDELNKYINDRENEFLELINSNNHKINELNNEMQNKDNTLIELGKEIEDKTNCIKEKEDIIKKLEIEIDLLKENINKLNEGISIELNKNNQLQDEIRNLNDNISYRPKTNNCQDCDILNMSIQELNEKLILSNIEYDKVNQELNFKESILSKISSSLSVIIEESNIFTNIKMIHNLIEEFKNNLYLKEKECQIYKEDNERKSLLIDLLVSKYKSLKIKLHENEKQTNSNKNQISLDKHNEIIRDINKNYDNLKHELASSKKINDELRVTINENKNQLEIFSSDNNRLREKISYHEEKEDKLNKNIHEMNELISNLDKSDLTKVLNSRISNYEKEQIQLNEKIKSLVEEKENIKNDLMIKIKNEDKLKLIIDKHIIENSDYFDKRELNMSRDIYKNIEMLIRLYESTKMQINQRADKENTVLLLEKEKEILFFKMDEKDKEIFDLKNKLMELEINYNTTKSNLDELNKNYEYLINNYKNADMINQLQKRIHNLMEEKTIYSETQNLILNNLTNEINELKARLSDDDKSLKSNEEVIDKVENHQIKDKVEEVNVKSIESKIETTGQKRGFGFLSSLIAPIFLTEKELENYNK